MKRIAIVGGGISGTAAAYFCQKAGGECVLFEASGRLGGTVFTRRVATEDRGQFVVELGPDGWVSEKPWARQLAEELGLGGEIVGSNDGARRTLLLRDGRLQAMPDGMRMMVPLDDDAIRNSTLLSDAAKKAYLAEPARAEELKHLAQADQDITVADFVRRHYGEEVTRTLAGPLLAGVFGGDIERLSARSVMPALVAMEREHGSLAAGLRAQQDAKKSVITTVGHRSDRSGESCIFTALRTGNQSLIEAMQQGLPASSIRLQAPVTAVARSGDKWTVTTATGGEPFDEVVLATPAPITQHLVSTVDSELAALHTIPASSSVLVALLFRSQIPLPAGFGFLVQQPQSGFHSALLAGTFSHQKYPHSVPPGNMLLRVFFGGNAIAKVNALPDAAIAELAAQQMQLLFPNLPAVWQSFVQRWPTSLPQYEIGHQAAVAEIEQRCAQFPGLHLLGNAYRGVGLPDMVRAAQAAAAAACPSPSFPV